MSNVEEIKDGDSRTFCTQLPENYEVKESPTFSFRGRKRKFCFHTFYDFYQIYIHTIEKDFGKPFKIHYSVDWILGENKALDKSIATIGNGIEYFWKIKQEKIREMLPSDYITGDVIKFEFLFPAPPVWTNTPDRHVETSVQTCSDLSPDFYAEIKCGEHSIKVPQIILCKQSEVLWALLQSDQQVGTSGIIEIQDMDINYVREFVNYLSTGALPELTFEKAKILYEAGGKYAVRSLMIRCSAYLQDNLSPENAVECFTLADACSDQTLKGRVKNYMVDEKIYLQDELWLPFSENFPKEANEVYRLSYKRKASEMDDE